MIINNSAINNSQIKEDSDKGNVLSNTGLDTPKKTGGLFDLVISLIKKFLNI